MPRATPVWVPMDDADRLCIQALAHVSFRAFSSDMRIARELDQRRSMAQPISLAQRATLYAMVWRYRKQLSTAPVVKAVLYLAEAQAKWQLAKDEARLLTLRPRRVDQPALFA